MLDAMHLISGFLGAKSGEQTEPVVPTQAEIDVLPSIIGPIGDPENDSTARVDKAGYVYLWETGDDGIGLWVRAGYVRSGRLRFGQVIDPNDIKWFELEEYKKRLFRAKKSLNAVRLATSDDIWDVTSGDDSRQAGARRLAGDNAGRGVSEANGAIHDDVDMI